MKITNFILALLFLVFAFVQINDPDPFLWILIYVNMTVLCGLAMFKIQYKVWLLITGIIYLVYAVFLFPGALEWFRSPDRSLLFDDLAKMQFPYIEETREFLGLMICIAALLFQYLFVARNRQL